MTAEVDKLHLRLSKRWFVLANGIYYFSLQVIPFKLLNQDLITFNLFCVTGVGLRWHILAEALSGYKVP
jgi:hypothetical protein